MNGILAVNGQDTYPLQLQKDKEPMSVQIYGTDIPLNGGAIQSAIDTKAKITSYKDNLNEFVNSLKTSKYSYEKDFFVGEGAKNLK